MAPKSLKFRILDVFTTERYKGNPLAIVSIPHSDFITQEQKLAITSEFNLSETVFLYQTSAHEWGADIFTVGSELPWAGHPTVGSAVSIANDYPFLNRATLNTKAGPVKLEFTRSPGSEVQATVIVPSKIHLHQSVFSKAAARILQPVLQDEDLKYDEYVVMSIANGMNFALIELDSVETLAKLSPSSNKTPKDFVKLDAGWKDTVIGAYFYVLVEEERLTKSKLFCRMFLGLIEDPATGSAASALAAYLTIHCDPWAPIHCNHTWNLEVEQGSDMGRKSKMGVRVKRRETHLGSLAAEDDGYEYQFALSGNSVEVMTGSLVVDVD